MRLIQIHCNSLGFGQFGHRFAKNTTLAEVSDSGKLSADSKAEMAITPAQFERLRWLATTPNTPLTYSDPDEAGLRLAEAQAELVTAREHLVALEREKYSLAEQLERSQAELAAMHAERDAAARQLAEMRADIEERQRVAEQLEGKITEQRAILEEIQSKQQPKPAGNAQAQAQGQGQGPQQGKNAPR